MFITMQTHPFKYILGDGIQVGDDVMIEVVFKLFEDCPSLADFVYRRISLTVKSIVVEHFGEQGLMIGESGDSRYDLGSNLQMNLT
jgi:hypothetical protein